MRKLIANVEQFTQLREVNYVLILKSAVCFFSKQVIVLSIYFLERRFDHRYLFDERSNL